MCLVAATSIFAVASTDGRAVDLGVRIERTAPSRAIQARHVPAAVSNGQARRLHPLAAERHLKLSINLPPRNAAQLDQLLSELYDPHSPIFHHYLSVAQFTEQFGPTQDDYAAVLAWARANGLRVTATTPNRRIVSVEAPVSAINRAFAIALSEYQHPTQDRTFFAASSEPVAAGLAVPLLQVVGLNNYVLPHSHLKHGSAPIAKSNGSGPYGEYLPSDMRAAYYGAGSLTGAGQSIGIFSYDGYLTSDVALYYSRADITAPSVPINNVLVAGYNGACVDPTSGKAPCDDGEQILDIVNAIGMAPGIDQILFYEGEDDTTILNQMAIDNAAKVLSSSWGWSPDDAASDDPIFKQFAAQGQTYINATGDYGAFSGSTNYDFPSVDPYILQVGGTDLATSGPGGAWVSETGWSGSSGGYESNTTIPSWQQTAGVINSTNKGSTTLRNSPDVAMEANFDNPTVDNGQFQTGYGGTSFAAPRWAGFVALINQQSVANGHGTIGFFNPILYNLALSSSYATTFHDITSGSNPPTDSNGKSIRGTTFNAVTGFDLVTGWGSPQTALIAALAGSEPVQSGSVTVGKTISGVAANVIGSALTFPFTISCSTPTASYAGSVTVAANSLSGSSAPISVVAGSSACTISEGTRPSAPNNYTWGTPAYTQPAQAALSSGGTASGTIGNPLSANPGSLRVTKTISGATASAIGTALNFPFTVACRTPTASYTGSIVVQANTLSGTSAAISLPAGTSACAISEGTLPAAPSNYSWGTPTYTQPNQAALAAGGALTGTITNPLAAVPTYTVTAQVTGNVGGSVAPASQTVNSGSAAAVNLLAQSGYHLVGVSGSCKGTLNQSVYTIASVTSSCALTASFAINTYTVTASAGANGVISPSSQSVNDGASASVTVTPASGFSTSVGGNACSLNYIGNNVWTTSALHASCAVTASFSAIVAGYVSLQPARVLDTRQGASTIDGRFVGSGPAGAGTTLNLSVLGRGGVASNGVTAVVLNVTATNPTAAGYITVWPSGAALPDASNLNFLPGKTIPNLVVVELGSNGQVSLYNSAGSTDLIADVVGYFGTGADLTSLVPARLLDTRANAPTSDGQFAGGGPLGPSSQLNVSVVGRAGLPGSGVGAVILNVTAANPTAPGYITVWASDLALPLASNLNFVAGLTIPNLVITQVSANGQVAFLNSAGSTDLIADVMGWFPLHSQLTSLPPARLLDTRGGGSTIDGLDSGTGALAANQTRNLVVTGRGNVPSSAVGAVVLNVTVTNPTANGYLTVWPSGAAQPDASNLNFVPAQTIPNLVIAKVGSNGEISLFNSAGTTDVVVDVLGWFPVSTP